MKKHVKYLLLIIVNILLIVCTTVYTLHKITDKEWFESFALFIVVVGFTTMLKSFLKKYKES